MTSSSKKILHPTDAETGSVLVMTCAVLTIIAVLVGTISIATGVEAISANNALADFKNKQATLSALQIADGILKKCQQDSADAYSDEYVYEWQCGDVQIVMRFRDEERKINLNKLTDGKGKINTEKSDEILRLLSLFVKEPRNVHSMLCDYVDGDSDGPFEYDAKNGDIETLEELLLLSGIDENAFYGIPSENQLGLCDVLTLRSSGRVNINTAPKEVLMSLANDIDSNTSDHIIESRQAEAFANIRDLMDRNLVTDEIYKQISGKLTTSGAYYLLTIETENLGCAKKCATVIKKSSSRSDFSEFREVR